MLSQFLSKGYFFHKEILKTDINTDVQIVVKGKMNQMFPLENNPSPNAWPEEADGGSLVAEMGNLHGVESFSMASFLDQHKGFQVRALVQCLFPSDCS